MRHIEYDEDDLLRIINTEDVSIYVFAFLGEREAIYKMYDSNHEGEQCEDHEHYVDYQEEVAFVFNTYDDPKWPIIIEYEDDLDGED